MRQKKMLRGSGRRNSASAAIQLRRYAWSPERHPVLGEYSIKVPKAHSALETNSPGSRYYSCSTGHSPASSPVALRCRSTRLTNLLNKNEVLDPYIDGEQEVAILNEKQNSSTRSVVSNVGRPPRPQSTVPSLPKSMKETLETYPHVDAKAAYLHQLTQEGTRDTCKIATLCNASVLDVFERFPHSEDYKSESVPSVEDIYEDLQDMQPPNVICHSIGLISGTSGTVSCLAAYFVCNVIFGSIRIIIGSKNYYDIRKPCVGGAFAMISLIWRSFSSAWLDAFEMNQLDELRYFEAARKDTAEPSGHETGEANIVVDSAEEKLADDFAYYEPYPYYMQLPYPEGNSY